VANGPVTFSWEIDPGATIYSLYIDDVLKTSPIATSKTVSGLSAGNHTWYVHADTGDQTEAISFKIKP
jgi:hypothetical protein